VGVETREQNRYKINSDQCHGAKAMEKGDGKSKGQGPGTKGEIVGYEPR